MIFHLHLNVFEFICLFAVYPQPQKYDLSFNFSSFIVYILIYTSRSEIKLIGSNEKTNSGNRIERKLKFYITSFTCLYTYSNSIPR